MKQMVKVFPIDDSLEDNINSLLTIGWRITTSFMIKEGLVLKMHYILER